MMTIVTIVVGVVLLAGVGALWRAVVRAPTGYEDESGFHRGIQPPPVEMEAAPPPAVATLEPERKAPAVLMASESGVPDHAYGTS